MNFNNLKIFRDGFKKLMDDGIVTQETFDMRYFRSGNPRHLNDFFSIHKCGTVGCLMGWAPFIEGLETQKKDFSEITGNLYFDEYHLRVFGIKGDLDDLVFGFLFGGDWAHFDNTPEGALARLDVFLAEDFKYLDEHFLPSINDTIVIGEVGDVYIF